MDRSPFCLFFTRWAFSLNFIYNLGISSSLPLPLANAFPPCSFQARFLRPDTRTCWSSLTIELYLYVQYFYLSQILMPWHVRSYYFLRYTNQVPRIFLYRMPNTSLPTTSLFDWDYNINYASWRVVMNVLLLMSTIPFNLGFIIWLTLKI